MLVRAVCAAALAGLFFVLCLPSAGQGPPPAAGGKMIPSAFRAYLVTDGRFPPLKLPDGKEEPDARSRVGKIHCLVCENGLAPVVAMFVRTDPKTLSADKGLGELIFQVNRLISIPKYRANKLASFVMFLRLEGKTKEVTVKTKKDDMEVETKVVQDSEYPDDENRKTYVDEIKNFATAMNTPNVPFGLAADKSKALTEWDVKETDEVTVFLYYRMRFVRGPWRFEKASNISKENVDEIVKSVEELLSDKK